MLVFGSGCHPLKVGDIKTLWYKEWQPPHNKVEANGVVVREATREEYIEYQLAVRGIPEELAMRDLARSGDTYFYAFAVD